MYTPTIGIEVHAELNTNSKMFCGCKNDPHASTPNTNICPVCLAHPGTLPVPNGEAIKCVLTFGVAVGGTLATYSEFDRKNYFYPDIPKAYQLSQYAFPFVVGGTVAGVSLTRVHLEEDTARSQHDKGEGSLVDYNRAGVPLMELVTEPVIHDAETAGAFGRELQLLLRTIGISTANMEKGELRVEANISVSKDETLGTKVEVKNLNSFRAMEEAIRYEVARQSALLDEGGTVRQETRGWNEATGETFVQRVKETAMDYRYFPDPDIPKYDLTQITSFTPENLATNLPELPSNKREKYSYLGLTSAQIETIIQDRWIDTYFAEAVGAMVEEPGLPALAANYLLTDLVPLVRLGAPDSQVLPAVQFVSLVRLAHDKKVTSRVVKDLLQEFALTTVDILEVAEARGLLVNFDAAALQPIIDRLMAAHPGPVAEYRAGKTAVAQFFLGQVMKETKGVANPALTLPLIEAALQPR